MFATNRMLLLFLLVAVVSVASCRRQSGVSESDVANSQTNGGEKSATSIRNLVSSEELILDLTKRLKHLNQSARNLKIPLGESSLLFAENIKAIDIKDSFDASHVTQFVKKNVWHLENEASLKLADLEIWKPLVDGVSYLDHAKFYFIEGQLDNELKKFEGKIGFSASGRLKSGKNAYISALSNVTWSRFKKSATGSTATNWKITAWHTEQLACYQSTESLFREGMSTAIRDREIVEQLSSSDHDKLTVEMFNDENKKIPGKYAFHFPEVSLEHPGISVVDLNQDGFDDFYLTSQYRSNLFFENQGDGTFLEKGDDYGLDLSGGCTATLFLDVDNDGDQDLFVGRARERASILINESGKFVDRTSECLDFDSPFMVSSIAAADFNNDGLLDVYISTYSPIEGSHGRDLSGSEIWPTIFFNDEERAEYTKRASKGQSYIDITGPPNLLLENLGKGRFTKAKANQTVGVWRKTLHSSWSDFDKDGDPDLYVCNDFAADDFYRNDGEEGFVRVNEQLGLSKIGFGMGVTWGDHNNDGFTDLYISNMYSKAGVRITRQFEKLNPQLVDIALGNYLYDGLPSDGLPSDGLSGDAKSQKFKLVSSPEESQAVVAKAGWSWGGLFTDVDNDGYLDLHVAAGYYTAPEEIAEDIDL